MATIRNRGEYQWEAQIRRKGYPAQRKTFETKSDAQAWSCLIEVARRERIIHLAENPLRRR
ncbi:hypothetical protein [Pseudomonas syringae]|nr:hypothetical protein [Pseudomonas syringae]